MTLFNSDSSMQSLKRRVPLRRFDPAVCPLCSLRWYVSLADRKFREQRKFYRKLLEKELLAKGRFSRAAVYEGVCGPVITSFFP
jgi:hypothetical protein